MRAAGMMKDHMVCCCGQSRVVTLAWFYHQVWCKITSNCCLQKKQLRCISIYYYFSFKDFLLDQVAYVSVFHPCFKKEHIGNVFLQFLLKMTHAQYVKMYMAFFDSLSFKFFFILPHHLMTNLNHNHKDVDAQVQVT